MFVVYKHTLPNGLVYIGETGQNPEKRWGNGFGYSNNKEFFELIVKYGWDNIKHEILSECETEEEAQILERAQIILHKDCTLNRAHSVNPNRHPQHKLRIQPVAQYTFDNKLVAIYSSIKEAHIATGVNAGNISSCCRGSRANSYRRVKSAGGFIWKFADTKEVE